MKKQLQILSTPGFIVGLILLLLNDWMLKDLFHNWATGKLSDFAGMFVFPMFWVALFPKLGKHSFWASVVWFIYWKSPYSQPLIDGWNSLGLYSIDRVVDLTDLMALVMVPLAYRYWRREPKPVPFRLHPVVPLGVAAFAFMATSKSGHTVNPKDTYLLAFPKDSLIQWMPVLDSIVDVGGWDNKNPDTIFAQLRSNLDVRCYSDAYQLVLVVSELSNKQTLLMLHEAEIRSNNNDSTLYWVSNDFKDFVINPLLEKHRTTQDSLPNIP